MREPREEVLCDLCLSCQIVRPDKLPDKWVRFWDSGPHGMDQKERILCDGCVDKIEQAKEK